MARYRKDLERDAGHLHRLTSVQEGLGRVGTNRHARRRERSGILEQLALSLGHPDRRARTLCEVCHGDQVVPVAMRHEHSRAAGTHPGEAEPSARVPLSAWLSLAFWALGTALLFSLGVAYRLVA